MDEQAVRDLANAMSSDPRQFERGLAALEEALAAAIAAERARIAEAVRDLDGYVLTIDRDVVTAEVGWRQVVVPPATVTVTYEKGGLGSIDREAVRRIIWDEPTHG